MSATYQYGTNKSSLLLQCSHYAWKSVNGTLLHRNSDEMQEKPRTLNENNALSWVFLLTFVTKDVDWESYVQDFSRHTYPSLPQFRNLLNDLILTPLSTSYPTLYVSLFNSTTTTEIDGIF